MPGHKFMFFSFWAKIWFVISSNRILLRYESSITAQLAGSDFSELDIPNFIKIELDVYEGLTYPHKNKKKIWATFGNQGGEPHVFSIGGGRGGKLPSNFSKSVYLGK